MKQSILVLFYDFILHHASYDDLINLQNLIVPQLEYLSNYSVDYDFLECDENV